MFVSKTRILFPKLAMLALSVHYEPVDIKVFVLWLSEYDIR